MRRETVFDEAEEQRHSRLEDAVVVESLGTNLYSHG
jgi:hypothetical protein